ncbi:hypothetical protein MHU86_5940 [Fragilaria crotonensis]|nr:hypothetical protein MHU86_5940 [Fragilaria crotonensis]
MKTPGHPVDLQEGSNYSLQPSVHPDAVSRVLTSLVPTSEPKVIGRHFVRLPLEYAYHFPEYAKFFGSQMFPTAAPRVGQSTAIIRSAEAHGFDSARITTIPDVVCSGTTKVSTLAEITPDSFAARFTEYGHDCTEKETLEDCDNSVEVLFVYNEDMDYNTSPQMTPLECKNIVEGPHLDIRLLLLTFDMTQHTAVPTTCPGLVECQNGVMIVSATSSMTDMGTLPRRVATSSVPSWADVSCQDAIEDSNRLLPSIDMRFHPIDRGRLHIFLVLVKMAMAAADDALCQHGFGSEGRFPIPGCRCSERRNIDSEGFVFGLLHGWKKGYGRD